MSLAEPPPRRSAFAEVCAFLASWPGRLTALGGLAAGFLLSPHALHKSPVLCPVRFAYGVECPGCGLGRSFVLLAHGDVSAAFAAHLFGPLVFAVFVVTVAAPPALRWLARTDEQSLVHVWAPRLAGALVCVWIARWLAHTVIGAV